MKRSTRKDVGLFAAVVAAIVVALVLPAVHADQAPSAPPAPPAVVHGLAPMPGDAPVPSAFMPPGSKESPVPSDEIFPPQSITIRFNHKKHVKDLKLSCTTCHGAAKTSTKSSDSLLPSPQATCDGCHDVDHGNATFTDVKAGKEENGQCAFCHLGATRGVGGRVARMVIPSPNLRFDHKKHLDRNIGCQQCHGRVEELELATREQLPRMAGCFSCHTMPGPSQGTAKGDCKTCHLTEVTGKMVQTFATGDLLPPDWLHLAGHTPDWIERHKTIAANDSGFCSNCHKEEQCAECHDGRVRERRVHPNDWISMHETAAKLDNPRCTSCHQQMSFCGDCHRRVGVARDGPLLNRPTNARFHPPREEWTTGPRGANHHAWEAQRNLNACVSCHSERDCATCHASRGLSGAQGVNPHPSNFTAKCSVAWSKNPRPCLVCHQSSDAHLASCK